MTFRETGAPAEEIKTSKAFLTSESFAVIKSTK